MATEWRDVSIGDIALHIAMGPFGSNIKAENFVSSGVPVIRGTNLTQGRFRADDFVFLTPEKADELANSVARPGDLVFTHRGTLGQVGVIPDAPYERYVVSQSQMKLTCDDRSVDPMFLYYYFLSPMGQHALLMHTSQTGVPAISRPVTSLRSVRLLLPPLLEQQAISSVLSALDDKIELNRRMSETLEEMVRVVHHEWFVDQNGRPSVNSLDWPPLSTWSHGQLGDLADEKRQGVDPETVAPDTPYIGLEHMPRRRTTLEAWGYAEGLGSNKHQFGRGDILFGKLRPYFHKVGVAPVNGICSTDIIVVTPKDETYFGFLLGVLSSDKFVQFTDSASTGTRMPRTSWKTMSTYEVRVPPPQVARVFNDLAQPIVARTINATLETKALSELRDTLLPKIISGEIRVPEAEQLVSEVA